MNVLYIEVILLVLLIGWVAFFMALTTGIPYHLRDRAFMRRITVLEKLLVSKLRCIFFIFGSTVRICGTYRGRSITFSSSISRGVRYTSFDLTPAKVPRQPMLLRSYPKVSEHVWQKGQRLVYSIFDGPVALKKAEAVRILDELVDAAEK